MAVKTLWFAGSKERGRCLQSDPSQDRRWLEKVRQASPSLVAALGIALLVMMGLAAGPQTTLAASGLIDPAPAERLGLMRAWFSQAQLDRSRNRLEQAVLEGDRLFLLTTAGTLQAIDAETGQTMWTSHVGHPHYPSLGPAVNQQRVAVVNGATLYVLDRATGRLILQRDLGGGPGGGPAVAGHHVFVPLFGGKVEGYSLLDAKQPAWYYASAGNIFQAAMTTPDSLLWATDQGYLYAASPNTGGVRYRFELLSPLAGAPAVQDRKLYLASMVGDIYALQERTGDPLWRQATGAPVSQSPVVIGEQVYVATEQPGLHCFSAAEGRERWRTPYVRQFVSASPTRVYAIDRYGDLSVLDAESGHRQGRLSTSLETTAVVNAQTDRLYLVSKTGLVQCLHEIGASEPYYHTPPASADSAEPNKPVLPKPKKPKPEQPPVPAGDDPWNRSDDGNPFGVENPFAGDNPFGEPAAPAAAPAEPNDNPAAGEEEPPVDPFAGDFEDPFGAF